MTYSYQQVLDASLAYFDGDQLAADTFAAKYALRDAEGALLELTPADLHLRETREFARIERRYPNPMSDAEIFALLSDVDHVKDSHNKELQELYGCSRGFGRVIPGGSAMAAIGNYHQIQSLSNCFVLASPHDSYGGIMKVDEQMAQIMKRRGGVGVDLSPLRPAKMLTTNAARTTDGIGVFMQRYSNTCREVAQNGRRGALMLQLNVHHPEIRTFINIKRDLTKITGANISIKLTDEFMCAVRDGTQVQLRFPVEPNVPHIYEEMIDARTLWQEIIESAYACAEPGLIFWDTMLRRSAADAYASVGFRTIATNPCAELPLCADDACRLMALNLAKYVVAPFTSDCTFDIDRFKLDVGRAMRLMDDLVDLEIEAIDRIIQKVHVDPEPVDVKATELELWQRVRVKIIAGRRTGLGITGLGDMLAMMNMRYGSKDSIRTAGSVYQILCVEAYRSSVVLAKERGAFPAFSHDLERDNEFINQVLDADVNLRTEHNMYGRRNIALLTTAPAGSTSLMTQTTSGCEPVYEVELERKRKLSTDIGINSVEVTIDEQGDRWQKYVVVHPGFKMWRKVTGLVDVKDSPYYGSSASEIEWVKKVDLQAAAQRWVDHAISNTTNLPGDVSIDVVKQVYLRGWETGCKGITIYRDGSRAGVLSAPTCGVTEVQPPTIIETHAPKRPKELECDIARVTVKGESYLVLVGLFNGLPYEVFAGAAAYVEVPKKAKKGILIKNGKKDGIVTYNLQIPVGSDDCILFKDIVNLFDNPVYGSFTRTISLALRHGIPVQYLVEQLRKDKHSDITSFSSVIARVLSKGYIPDGTRVTQDKTCSSCGSTNLQYQQGCSLCIDCGSSKCS